MKAIGYVAAAVFVALGAAMTGCSDDSGTTASGTGAGGFGAPGMGGGANGPGGGGVPGSGGGFATGGSGIPGSGGSLPGAGGTGPGAGGADPSSGGTPGAGGAGPPGPVTAQAIGANTTVGLDWTAIPGAEQYAVYWATATGVTPATGQRVVTSSPAWVHRGLTNGTPYYYVVAPIVSGVEGTPSPEATATPGGEWVLEELGSGIFEDVRTGGEVPRVAVPDRIHLLLFAEGYAAADLAILHAVSDHDGARTNDVDRWVDLVFGIQPYTDFRQAFVVWYLPRASATHIDGGSTAFMVPADTTSGIGQVPADGETSRLAWEAIGIFPFAPANFDGPSQGVARNVVTPFLVFDPSRGRAGLSGRALSLRNPANTSQRVAACFGIGHAHEFTHAFSSVRDEYLEDDNSPPTQWSSTSNVVGTTTCSELPWQHLLQGSAVNPSQGDLVGAFGRPQHGYHPELLCLMNGTHDNATYYGGSGLLRVEDRMCNFCREMAALRIYQRSGIVPAGQTGTDTWATEYRSPFFSRHPFFVPAVVPQTNDVRNPSQGTPYYEACTLASYGEVAAPAPSLPSGDLRAAGCVLDPQ